MATALTPLTQALPEIRESTHWGVRKGVLLPAQRGVGSASHPTAPATPGFDRRGTLPMRHGKAPAANLKLKDPEPSTFRKGPATLLGRGRAGQGLPEESCDRATPQGIYTGCAQQVSGSEEILKLGQVRWLAAHGTAWGEIRFPSPTPVPAEGTRPSRPALCC